MIINSNNFNDVYESTNKAYELYCTNPRLILDGQKEPPFHSILHNIGNIIQYFKPEIKIEYFISKYWQSCTEISANDTRLNPLFINIGKQYNGSDLELCYIHDSLIDNSILN